MAARFVHLTDTWLKKATATDGPAIKDTKQGHLVCRISPKGKKSWALAGKFHDQHISIKLGDFQQAPGKPSTPVEMSTEMARDAAKLALEKIKSPAHHQKKAPTLGEAFDLHCQVNPASNTPGTLADHQARFDTYVRPFKVEVDGLSIPLGDVPLTRIEGFHLDDLRTHVHEAVRAKKVKKAQDQHQAAMKKWKAATAPHSGRKHFPKPILTDVPDEAGARSANQALTRLTTVFKFAIRRKLVPADWQRPTSINRIQEPGQDDTNHLRLDQAPAFYAAVEALRNRSGYKVENNDAIADCILACLWTGGRKGNVMAMEWEHLDLDSTDPAWRIPRHLYKTRKKLKTGFKVIPLLPWMVQLLQRRQGCHPRWVFPLYQGNLKQGKTTAGDAHIKDFRKSLEWVKQQAGIEQRLTIHGLRHSLGTWMHQQGATMKVIAGQLGHDDLTSAQRYAHNEASHVRSAASMAVEASFTVVETAPGEVQASLPVDDWVLILQLLQGHQVASRLAAATGIKALE